jgi:hypothetical protein
VRVLGGPFGKRGLEGGADKPVGDCRQNSGVSSWPGRRGVNVGFSVGRGESPLVGFPRGVGSGIIS